VFHCDYAGPGRDRCPAWRCDCFVDTFPDDPFGLHPEAFVVGNAEPDPPATCPECGHAPHMAGWCVHDSHPPCDCNADPDYPGLRR
jgi:hypothetical protein